MGVRSINGSANSALPQVQVITRRRLAIGAALALVVVGLAPSAASAAAPTSFSVTPKAPRDSQAIKVAWRPSGLRGKATYRFEVRSGVSTSCDSRRSVAIAAWRPGATVRATLRLTADKKSWCPGPARVLVVRTTKRGAAPVERLDITITDDAATENPGPFGSAVKVTLLEGSAMTVRVAGRPDRSSALTGELRGYLPGKFVPNSDLQLTLTRGAISATSLAADPACVSAGRQYPSVIGLAAEPVPYTKTTQLSRQTMTLLSAGRSSLALTLDGDHVAALTGCKSAGGDAATLPLGIAGDVGPTGLVVLTIGGTAEGLKLSDGATASVAITLVVRVDLN